MRAALLTGAAALALAAPAAGRMHHRVPHHVDLPAALAVAQATWPAACSPIKFYVTDLSVVGYSAQASPGDCSIGLDLTWPAWSQAYLCSTLVHEVGHLAGLGHSTDPASPMYPTIHRLPQCPGPFRWLWSQWR